MQRFIVRITQENLDIAESSDFGCFILPDSLSDDFIIKFIDMAQYHGKLVLISGQNALDKYQKFSADGLIIDVSKSEFPQKEIKALKKAAPKALLGAISRNRRHEAMIISECEPDFIIFKIWSEGLEKNKELLSWYNELFLIQSAVFPQDDADYKECAADFVIIDNQKIIQKK